MDRHSSQPGFPTVYTELKSGLSRPSRQLPLPGTHSHGCMQSGRCCMFGRMLSCLIAGVVNAELTEWGIQIACFAFMLAEHCMPLT